MYLKDGTERLSHTLSSAFFFVPFEPLAFFLQKHGKRSYATTELYAEENIDSYVTFFENQIKNQSSRSQLPHMDICLDTAGVQVHTQTLAEGLAGQRVRELHADRAGRTVRLDDATPHGAGVATASGGLAPADAALRLLAVVHVRDTLAGVPFRIGLRRHVLNANDGGVLVLTVQTAAVASERGLHVEAGALAGTVDLRGLLLQLRDLLAAVDGDGGRHRCYS